MAWLALERCQAQLVEWRAKEYTPMSQRGNWKHHHICVLTFRDVNNEEEKNDGEKLMMLRTEYERYKDLWGLNLHYSHLAGPTQNYSKLILTILIQNSSAAKWIIIFSSISCKKDNIICWPAAKKNSPLSCKKEVGAANGAHLLWHINLWPSREGCEGQLKIWICWN